MKYNGLPQLYWLPLVGIFLVACSGASSTVVEEQAPAEEIQEEEQVEEQVVVDDIVAVMPEVTELLFENPWVRVVQFTLAPGESLPPHHGRDRVVFSRTDAHILWSEGDAEEREVHWEAGDLHTHGAEVHSLTNLGEATITWVVFARLDTPLEDRPEPEDVVHTDEGLAEVLFEDDLARVIHVGLEPDEATERHEGGYRIIFSLSDYTIEFAKDEEPPVETSWSEGDVHWHEPDRHQVANTGESRAEYLVIQYKR